LQTAEPTPIEGVTQTPEPAPTVTVTVQPEPVPAPAYGTVEAGLDLFVVFAVIMVVLVSYIAVRQR